VRGVKITDVDAIEAAGFDRRDLADAQLRSAIKQLMIDGFFHGDPHPGNVLVDLDTGVVTYIDLGMVGQITINQRVNVIRLLYAIQQRDAGSMADVLRSLSVAHRDVDVRAYRQEMERRISRHWMPGINPTFGAMMNDVFDVLELHGLVLDSQLTLGVKFLVQLDAITVRLFPQGALVPMAVEILGDMLVEQVTVENVSDYLVKEVTRLAGEVVQQLPSLEEATLKWLGMYQRGQFQLKLDTSQFDDTVSRLQGFGSQILVGIMLVGMIIGSAIAATMPALSGQFWSFVPRLAVLGYTVSMVLATVLILRLVVKAFGRRD
jgi:ubiquinone biosynthesis protein